MKYFFLLIFFISNTYADRCKSLFNHGINNIETKYGASHLLNWKWQRYCNSELSDDSDAISAGVTILAKGSGFLNASQARKDVKKWCDKNESLYKDNSLAFEQAQAVSRTALEAWEKCLSMTKSVALDVTISDYLAKGVHIHIDSTSDGDIRIKPINVKGFSCSTSMTDSKGRTVKLENNPVLRNHNTQITCVRNKATVSDDNGVAKLEYAEGHIIVNTTGPSLPLYFNKVVDEYHMTPPASILAFATEQCPKGWSRWKRADGRFLRGLDPNGEFDEVRQVGSWQNDAFQDHKHNHGSSRHPNGGMFNTDRSKFAGGDQDRVVGNFGILGASGDNIRKADETRPKNVAVLFCKKDGLVDWAVSDS